jgi:hypothetical protein
VLPAPGHFMLTFRRSGGATSGVAGSSFRGGTGCIHFALSLSHARGGTPTCSAVLGVAAMALRVGRACTAVTASRMTRARWVSAMRAPDRRISELTRGLTASTTAVPVGATASPAPSQPSARPAMPGARASRPRALRAGDVATGAQSAGRGGAGNGNAGAPWLRVAAGSCLIVGWSYASYRWLCK